jgi:hypothetical protein
MQPMIVAYAHRPARWVNIWSESDPISGHLDCYDHPERPDPEKAVQNWRDLDATTPLVAHTEYWSNPGLIRLLYGELTGHWEPEIRPSLCRDVTPSVGDRDPAPPADRAPRALAT